MVLNADKDTRILVWDGNIWSDKGEVSTNAQSSTFMSIAGAYESNSGDAILVYSDNTNITKYRAWNGASLSSQQSAPALQDVPRWLKIASSPNTDELLFIANTKKGHTDAMHWSGSSWTKTSLSSLNSTSTRAGIGVSYEND